MSVKKEVVLKPKKSNYISWNRSWVTVKRHIPLVLKSASAGILTMLVWYFVISRYDLSFYKDDENPLLFIVIVVLALVYAIFAGYATNKVLEELKLASKAVVQYDMDTFLTYRDEQLPILAHLPIAVISLFLFLSTLLYPYQHTSIALFTVFSLTFIMTLNYLIVIELDNYENSIWFKEKVPREWYDINIEEHFKNKYTDKLFEKEKK